jgi:hypothetical protein
MGFIPVRPGGGNPVVIFDVGGKETVELVGNWYNGEDTSMLTAETDLAEFWELNVRETAVARQERWNDRPDLELDTEPLGLDDGRLPALAFGAGTGAAGMASQEMRLPGL